MSATVRCRAPPRPAGWCRTPRPRSRWPGCCAGRRSRTCRGASTAPATSTPRGSNRARNCSSVGTRSTGRRRVGRRRRARRARRRRPARPSAATISGLTSTLTTSGRVGGQRPTARPARRPARRGPPRPRRGTRRAASASPGRRSSPRRRPRLIGTGPEHDVGDGLGEDAADAEHHVRRRTAGHARTPAISSRLPRDHRGDEHVDRRRRRASPRPAARWPRRSTAAGVAEVAACTRPRSVLWAMASPFSLTTTGKPMARRRRRRPRRRWRRSARRPVARRRRAAAPSTRPRTACVTASTCLDVVRQHRLGDHLAARCATRLGLRRTRRCVRGARSTPRRSGPRRSPRS